MYIRFLGSSKSSDSESRRTEEGAGIGMETDMSESGGGSRRTVRRRNRRLRRRRGRGGSVEEKERKDKSGILEGKIENGVNIMAIINTKVQQPNAAVLRPRVALN